MKGLKGKQRTYVSGFAFNNSSSGHIVETEDSKRLPRDSWRVSDRFLVAAAMSVERSAQIQRAEVADG